jgi:hypothetical protein
MAGHLGPTFGRLMMSDPSFGTVTSSDGRAVPDDVGRSVRRVGGAAFAGLPFPEEDALRVRGFLNRSTPSSSVSPRNPSSRRRPRQARALISGTAKGVQ